MGVPSVGSLGVGINILHPIRLPLAPAHCSTFTLNMPSRKMLLRQNLLLLGSLGLPL